MSRLSEILGVEEGQKFGFDILDCKMSNNGRMIDYYENGNWHLLYDATIICEMINNPEKIKIIPTKPKLTEQQIIAIKGRIAEGTLWAVKDISGEEIAFYSSTPCSEDYYATSMNVKLYDFLKVGQAVYLPDLIGDENNE